MNRLIDFLTWLFGFSRTPDEEPTDRERAGRRESSEDREHVVRFEPVSDVLQLRQRGRPRAPSPPLIDLRGISPATSTPRHGNSPIPCIDLTVTRSILVILACGGPFFVSADLNISYAPQWDDAPC